MECRYFSAEIGEKPEGLGCLCHDASSHAQDLAGSDQHDFSAEIGHGLRRHWQRERAASEQMMKLAASVH
jgi:hypothetical protein